jgi:hypothetical protein
VGKSATAGVSPLRNASRDLTRSDADAYFVNRSAARVVPISSEVAAAAVAAREGLKVLSDSLIDELLLLLGNKSEDGGEGREQSKNKLAEVAVGRRKSSHGVSELKTVSQLRRRVASGFSIAAVCTGEILCHRLCITKHSLFW